MTRRLATPVLALLLGPAAACHGSPPPSLSPPVAPPVPVDAPPVPGMPSPVRATLPNGLRVLVVTDDRAPFFEAMLVLRGGWRTEPASLPGIATLAAEAAGRSAIPTAARRALDSLGLRLEVGGAPTDGSGLTTTFRLGGPSPGMAEGLKVLASLVMSAEIDDEGLRRARRSVSASVSARNRAPVQVASQAALELLGRDAARASPAPAELEAITAEDLRRFLDATYTADRGVLVLAAPGNAASNVALVDRLFADWGGGRAPQASGATWQSTSGRAGGRRYIDHAGAAQGVAVIGVPISAPGDPDYPAAMVLRIVLFQRLDRALREDRGWTYGVQVPVTMDPTSATLTVRASVPPAATTEALMLMLEQMTVLRTDNVTAEELEDVRHRLMAGRARQGEQRGWLVGQLAAEELLGLDSGYWSEFNAAAVAATAADLRAAARRYFDPARLALVTLIPARGTESTLVPTTSSEQAGAAFRAGYIDLLHHNEGRGADALDRALYLDPGFGLARVLRAYPVYLATAGRFSEMERLREIDAGIAALANAPPAERFLAEAWRGWAMGDLPGAVVALDSALALLPGDPFLVLEHARLAMETGDTEVGTARLERLRARFPEFAPVYMPLAYARRDAGDTLGAIQAARDYVRLAPDQPYAYYVLARFLRDAGSLEEATAAFGPVLALPPSWLDPIEVLATLEQLRGRGADARALLGRAADEASDTATRVARLRYAAISQIYDGYLADGRAALMRTAREAESAGQSRMAALDQRFLAVIDGVTGQGDSIPNRLRRARQLDPENLRQQYAFGAQAYSLAGAADSARHYFGLLMSMPRSGQAVPAERIIGGLVRLAEGDPRGALREVRPVPESGPYPMAVLLRLEALGQLGRHEEAAELARAWRTPDRLNLRGVPHALAWLRAAQAAEHP